MLLLLILLSAGWLIYTALKARSELETVRDIAHQLEQQVKAGDTSGARASAESLRQHAAAADDAVGGPVWAIASAVPYLGDPFDSIQTLAASANSVARSAVPPMVSALNDFADSHTSSGAVNIKPLVALLPEVGRARASVDAALRDIGGTSSSTWIGSVDTARRKALDDLRPIGTALDSVVGHEDAIRTLAGTRGTRNYLVAFENEAELRPVGGLAGSFAQLQAADGLLKFSRFESDDFLIGVKTTGLGLNLGADFGELYQGAADDVRDADSSPHFPDAAQIWSAMWQRKTGQHIDGVLALDPTVLSYLLSATGPVTAPDGTEITAGNVVQLTQQTLYNRYPTQKEAAARKSALAGIAKASSHVLVTATEHPEALRQAVTKSIRQGRLVFWSRDPYVESWIGRSQVAGTLPADDRPYVAVTLNNDTQSKLDYYVHASFDYSSTCSGGTRHVTATVVVRNDAPANLPPYVVGQSDPPGNAQMYVGVYASPGAKFGTVTDHGRQPFNVVGTDQGHPAYLVYAMIPRGTSDTIVYHWSEPARPGKLTVRPQPMIDPMSTKIQYAACS